MSINRVIISGNLTRDPELRSTSGGYSVLSGGIAVNERRKNKDGEWEDVANFVNWTMWGRRAESVSRYLAKGSKVCLDGRLRYSKYKDKSGAERSSLDVVVDELDFMSKDGGTRQAQRQDVPQALYDDDIPF